MLRRLPISLAQLKAENNSKKTKVGKFCIVCIDKKNSQKKSIKVQLTLFKTWKQSL